MLTASELAGYFAAHAIWSVSEGQTLIPMLAFTTQSGERKMIRLALADQRAAVEQGRGRLESNEMDANDAVLLHDGRITIRGKKLDAILVEMRAYFAPDAEATLAVPYTPPAGGAFRVHKPKLLLWKECDDFDLDACLGAFFDGVSQHEQGSAVWNRCLDESQ